MWSNVLDSVCYCYYCYCVPKNLYRWYYSIWRRHRASLNTIYIAFLGRRYKICGINKYILTYVSELEENRSLILAFSAQIPVK